jgi:hypothetical protein
MKFLELTLYPIHPSRHVEPVIVLPSANHSSHFDLRLPVHTGRKQIYLTDMF